MSVPCSAFKRLGCPDGGTVLVCHQPSLHPGLNHYDAQEQVWWQPSTGVEPVLFNTDREPDNPGGRRV